MSDLISRQAAIDLAKTKVINLGNGEAVRLIYIDLEDVESLPAIRQKEVITCKECRFYLYHRCQATRGLDDWRTENDYCYRAERMEYHE